MFFFQPGILFRYLELEFSIEVNKTLFFKKVSQKGGQWRLGECWVKCWERAGAVRGCISKECSQLHGTEDPAHSDLNKGKHIPFISKTSRVQKVPGLDTCYGPCHQGPSPSFADWSSLLATLHVAADACLLYRQQCQKLKRGEIATSPVHLYGQ